MKLEYLAESIGLPGEVLEEGKRWLNGPEFALAEPLARRLTQADAARKAQLALEEQLGDNPIGMLVCHLYAAGLVQDWYVRRGIPEQVYLDTMGCFTRFLEETRRNTGAYRFDRGFWTYRQTSMQLFRIGQLEYEILPEEKAVSLHIPSDADFSPGAVDASLAQAKDFFESFQPECAQWPLVCLSWLLSPELKKVLKEGSNILSFQRRFQILQVYPQEKGFLQWVFGAEPSAPVEALPENTSMQRGIKRLLLAGGSIGSAKGILNTTAASLR